MNIPAAVIGMSFCQYTDTHAPPPLSKGIPPLSLLGWQLDPKPRGDTADQVTEQEVLQDDERILEIKEAAMGMDAEAVAVRWSRSPRRWS